MLYTVHHVSVPPLLPPLTVELIGVRWRLHRVWEGGGLLLGCGLGVLSDIFSHLQMIGSAHVHPLGDWNPVNALKHIDGDFFNFNGASVCLMPYLQKKVGPANIWKALPILRSWKGKRDERQSPLGSFHTNRGQFDKENSPLHSCLIKYIHTYITNIVQNIKMCGRFGRLQLLLYSDNFFVWKPLDNQPDEEGRALGKCFPPPTTHLPLK